jgi:hypothetical protein
MVALLRFVAGFQDTELIPELELAERVTVEPKLMLVPGFADTETTGKGFTVTVMLLELTSQPDSRTRT